MLLNVEEFPHNDIKCSAKKKILSKKESIYAHNLMLYLLIIFIAILMIVSYFHFKRIIQKNKSIENSMKEYKEKISSLEDRIKEDNKMIERLKLKREDFKLRLNVEDHSFDTVYLNLHGEREAIDKLQDEISTLESEFEALQDQNYQYKQIIYSKTHTRQAIENI